MMKASYGGEVLTIELTPDQLELMRYALADMSNCANYSDTNCWALSEMAVAIRIAIDCNLALHKGAT
jgi:hypothetical protein